MWLMAPLGTKSDPQEPHRVVADSVVLVQNYRQCQDQATMVDGLITSE